MDHIMWEFIKPAEGFGDFNLNLKLDNPVKFRQVAYLAAPDAGISS